MKKKQHMGGVHNDQYNLDYYDDGSIEVFDHKKPEICTTFDKKTVDLLLLFIQRHKENRPRLIDLDLSDFNEVVNKNV